MTLEKVTGWGTKRQGFSIFIIQDSYWQENDKSQTVKKQEPAEDREEHVQYEDEKINLEWLSSMSFYIFFNNYVWASVLVKHDALPFLKQQS